MVDKIIVCNNFSLDMLTEGITISKFKKITPSEFRDIIENEEYISRIGNQEIANILGVPYNKGNIRFEKGITLAIAKLQGKPLPKGAIELPEGNSFNFYEVSLC